MVWKHVQRGVLSQRNNVNTSCREKLLVLLLGTYSDFVLQGFSINNLHKDIGPTYECSKPVCAGREFCRNETFFFFFFQFERDAFVLYQVTRVETDRKTCSNNHSCYQTQLWYFLFVLLCLCFLFVFFWHFFGRYRVGVILTPLMKAQCCNLDA